ncbi:GspE/PulE family protein [Zavarzinella formosa]|uniref:GspE/PulE family protein n=1 Tax=Zavarzinella formosa TaxID=360055 RepID=UPI0002FD0352|nr:GspE/PulE family protein [Zavarzinella formosa]
MAKATRGDFVDILIKKGALGPDQIEEAERLASSSGIKMQEALVKTGYVTLPEIMEAIAEFHNLQFVDLEEVEIPKAIIELVPESVARENIVLPLSLEGNTLKLITSDPTNFDVIQKLTFILNKDVQPVLADHEQIRAAINRHYGQSETESMDSMLVEFTDTAIDFTQTEQSKQAAEDDYSDAPVVKLCNLLIQEAVALRASDIHVEPFADRVRVRYRIDGVLAERDSVPRRLFSAMTSRLKIMGAIDIAEKRRPQDGRIKVNIQGRHFDLRVSMLPTVHGQSTVMRILDRSNIQVSIRDLGFGEEDYLRFQQIIKRPNGIFLVTGPTGSGKTTTLYAALNELNRPDRKLITAEDPVEYYLPGINQVEVKHKIGLDFARIIRAMLRQAPNIILVGEIRDKETAEIAVQASLTGHLVFSTLHTNDAPSAITRLGDIGVQPFLIASSVIAILAQRLVRVNCVKCKKPYKPDPAEIRSVAHTEEMLAKATFMKGTGCNHCNQKGFRGRKGIFEMMKLNSAIREMTFNMAPSPDIRKVARANGMRTLLEDGTAKAFSGLTTLDEVLSTCHAEFVELESTKK